MRIFAAGLIVAFVALAQPGGQSRLLPESVHLSGVVVDAAGKPVAGAMVIHDGMSKFVETDANGRFALDTRAPAVVIEKAGYHGKRVEVLGAREIRVTLESFSKPFPVCEETASRVGIAGYESSGFYFERIPGIKASRLMSDVDYVARWYSIKVSGKKYAVRQGTGALWGFGEPEDERVWQSVQFDEVVYDVGGADIVDARGTMPDGTQWRYLGSFNVSADYEDVPPEAAAMLDKLLDSGCWKPAVQRPGKQ
ncbi:MAG TPA: carboxypeptidase-like regulatory domain-containing protein [Terracidiphilus sp.]|nr:carboxypeptidase-like regulatory domain-containing protein [Terracidiphilus sp.]